jgi:hypothetical protein
MCSDQLLIYFERALTLGASMMSQEQQKMRQTGHRNKGVMLMLLPEYFECA